MTKKNLYAELAEVQAQRKLLEAREAVLKIGILGDMDKNGVETFTNDYGKFTRSCRTSYTYTEAVKKLEEKVKLAKIKEEKRGVATKKETVYLTFTAPKID